MSHWFTGVPQSSILGPLLLLVYINYLSEFSDIHDRQTSANNLNNNLEMILNWAFQRKMNFNPDPTKQAQEVIFSRKTIKLPQPSLAFSNADVTQSIYQKHLGIILDSKTYYHELP